MNKIVSKSSTQTPKCRARKEKIKGGFRREGRMARNGAIGEQNFLLRFIQTEKYTDIYTSIDFYEKVSFLLIDFFKTVIHTRAT